MYIYILCYLYTLYTGTHVDVKPEETFSLPSLLGFFFPILKPERQTRWLTKDSWNIYALTLLYTLLEANQTKIIPEVFLFQRAFFWCPPPKKNEQQQRVRRSLFEGLVTFLMFPVLVGLAFAADKGGGPWKLP